MTDPNSIAITGMATRLPGARTVEEFWANLRDGVESISQLTDDDLAASGLDPAATRGDSRYVRAKGVLDGIDLFDAAFFGILPKDAELMDPQQRVFLELCHEALERAGCDPARHPGPIGVYAGAYIDTYLLANLCAHPAFLKNLVASIQVGSLQTELGNDKDYLATRVSFKLGLRGPSMTLQTACSTSLVAIAQACQSLLTHQCDMALAGGVTITLPQRKGYFYQEDGMLSPDGHCRAFDARAAGTVFSNGAGVLVLKRLEDALADRDPIHAVIRGTAINNDGGAKFSYTAPSVEGQAEVIALAHALAGVSARDIGYVEAHGTGTPLGDPIEIAALTKAFRATTDDTGFCAIGSVKTNLGHLDVASGVTAIIKTALALEHGQIPPTLHYETPNPKIDFDSTPFRVAAQLTDWPRGDAPRLAGVSSFGVGGTNVHAVLEEAPEIAATPSARPRQLLVLSARTATALDVAEKNLAAHLAGNPALDLADVAYTLQVGRKTHAHRRTIIVEISPPSRQDAKAEDSASSDLATWRLGGESHSGQSSRQDAAVVFMFPGQGAQHPGMARELYDHEPVFRDTLDQCADLLTPHLGCDLREVLHGSTGERLTQTLLAQPAIFVVEYALARLWLSWGVKPAAMIGHSVGEFVAACLAGVLTLDDALRLLATRGRLMGELPGGAMLSVRLPESEVLPLLGDTLDLAAVNGASLCVVSGPHDAVAELEKTLAAREIAHRRLHTSHGFHSRMMDPVLEPFAAEIARAQLSAPEIPILSTVTADWLTAKQATDPQYWSSHLRQTVRFHDAIQALQREPDRVYLEVGPGQTLSTLARQGAPKQVVIPSLAHAEKKSCDCESILSALGRLWIAGVAIDWENFHAHDPRRRVVLPTYPFERKRFWVDPPVARVMEAVPAIEPTLPLMPPTAIPETTMPAPDRTDTLTARLRAVLSELSGIDVDDLDASATLLELGLDSLLLTQVSKEFHDEFGVRITMRQLIDELPTIAAIAAHLDATLPREPAAAPAPAPIAATPQPAAPADGNLIERTIAQQMALMQQQLDLLRGSAPAPAITPTPACALPTLNSQPSTLNLSSAPTTAITRTLDTSLTDRQRRHIAALVARYTARTRLSKKHTQEHRQRHADPRTASGFNRLWKEMCYPIVVERSRGSRLLDLDGNEYIDLLNGFGPGFLGHSPAFITEALHAQLDRGIEVGPQTPLAGQVAELLCELTGNERASFVNTGSEAVQAAMRLARTVTGRDKIALFTKDYHGNFDEVLVRGAASGRAMPIAPGIPKRAVDDIIVLDYGSPEALEILRTRGHEIAAVLVEPVQSRRPEFQPREFIHELRRITEETGTLLVFDEVITGFRDGLGGAQAWYGIRADLATYGKVLGGGMPIGVVAGRAQYMDTFDGGMWQFGDDSFPEKGVTFFAGTFVRHPMAMAAAWATLNHLKQQGPALWEQLNARAARLAGTVDRFMVESGAPFRMPHFCSQMFVRVADDQKYANLLFFHLRERGIYLLESFPSYLTTAHTDADIDYAIEAFKESVWELQDAGFFKESDHPQIKRPSGPPRQLAAPSDTFDLSDPPITEAQREIWLASQMGDDASCAYNEATTLRLRGPLDVERLRAALQQVVQRHDALRTTFSPEGDTLRIAPELTLDIPLIDADDATLAAITEREATQPFDLEHGPLIRATIARLGEEEHVVFLTAHHIVCDGWSFNVVIEELSRIHNGEAAQLEPPRQFSDYARWQHAHAETAEGAETESYWLAQFTGPLPQLDLPTDRPRPPMRTFEGATERRHLDAALAREVRRIGAKQGCTLYATLLAVFQALLHRLTGQDDIVVGIPAAGQSIEGNGNMIGHCVSFLPLRTRVAGDAPFASHLATAKRGLLDAFEHQHYTYGRLIPQLAIPRDPARMPLVEVEFNVERMDYFEKFRGLEAEFEPSPKRFVNFNLFLNIIESAAGLTLDCDYNTALFDPATIQRWLGLYETLLRGLAADPQRPLAELPLLSEEDRKKILVEWNDTAVAWPDDPCLHELICKDSPDAIAVVAEGREISYRELDERSNQIARHLQTLGVAPETLVGICMEPSVEMIAGLLGILKAGGAYVPLDPSFPADRLAFMAADAALPVILTQDRLAASLPPHSAQVVRIDADAISQQSAAPLDRTATPDQLAYVIYTSGSTGQPKGVEIPHRAVANFLRSMRRAPGIAPDDILLAVTTLSFDIAALEIFLPLTAGARVALVSREVTSDGAQLFEQLANSRATMMQATPATWKMLIEAGWQGGHRMKLLCGGEPLPRSLATQLLPRCGELWNMYGPTETTIWSTITRVENPDAPIDIGRPIANTHIFIVDAEMNPVPIGIPGELLIGGHGLARGYHARPELTAAKFIPNSQHSTLNCAAHLRPRRTQTTQPLLFRTGDLARWLPDGRIECLGRADGQVKVRGFRIELGEIESALRDHPKIKDAAVIVREDAPGDRRLVSYIVQANGAPPPAAELRETLQRRLPDYMIPAAFVTLAALPLTPNGKLDRRALPAPDAAAATARREHTAPRTPEEEKLAGIWSSVLRVERVGIHDNLFDLGADSLLVFQIATRARQAGLAVSPKLLFQHRTIAALAAAALPKSEPSLETTPTPAPAITALSRAAYRRPATSAPAGK